MEAASDDVTTTQQQPPPCDIVIDSSEINESNEGKCDDTDMQKGKILFKLKYFFYEQFFNKNYAFTLSKKQQ